MIIFNYLNSDLIKCMLILDEPFWKALWIYLICIICDIILYFCVAVFIYSEHSLFCGLIQLSKLSSSDSFIRCSSTSELFEIWSAVLQLRERNGACQNDEGLWPSAGSDRTVQWNSSKVEFLSFKIPVQSSTSCTS